MSQEDLAERLDAVERRLDAAYPEPEGDGETLERVEAFAERLADLEAAVEAVEGYVGEIERIDGELERRADAALAAGDRLEERLDAVEGRIDAIEDGSGRATAKARDDRLDSARGSDAHAGNSGMPDSGLPPRADTAESGPAGTVGDPGVAGATGSPGRDSASECTCAEVDREQDRSRHAGPANAAPSSAADGGVDPTDGDLDRADSGLDRTDRDPDRASGDIDRAGGGPDRAGGDPGRAGGGPDRASGDIDRAGGGPGDFVRDASTRYAGDDVGARTLPDDGRPDPGVADRTAVDPSAADPPDTPASTDQRGDPRAPRHGRPAGVESGRHPERTGKSGAAGGNGGRTKRRRDAGPTVSGWSGATTDADGTEARSAAPGSARIEDDAERWSDAGTETLLERLRALL